MNQSIKQKRMMKEIEHLSKNPSEEYTAAPLNNDLYTWHFTLRGPTETEFEDGIYHGKIIFPFNYPLEPPDIYFINKSGRFEVNSKICLTITGFHADQWNSSWTMRTILEALISMFPEKEQVQSVGSVNNSIENRKRLAKDSWNFECEKCGPLNKILKQREKIIKEAVPQQTQDLLTQQQHKKEEKEQMIEIDVEKEKQNLDELQQRIKQLQQDKSQDNPIQIGGQQIRTQGNYQQFIQEEIEKNNQYGFNSVLQNLEEVMNVINSIKIISRNNTTQSQDNPGQKEEKPQQHQKNQDDEQNKLSNSDSLQINNTKSQDGENQNESQNNQTQPEQQKNQEKEITINDSDKNQATTIENQSSGSNQEQEMQQQNEENKDWEDINDEENKESNNQEEKDEQTTTLESKEEARKKIKKLDSLLLITLILFVFYITFLIQMSI